MLYKISSNRDNRSVYSFLHNFKQADTLFFLFLQAELARVREQLRQAEDQLQASRQQATLLASELRDSASTRDHSMTELYRARLEADKLRASLADAQAECQRMESQLDRMRSTAHKEVVSVKAGFYLL